MPPDYNHPPPAKPIINGLSLPKVGKFGDIVILPYTQ